MLWAVGHWDSLAQNAVSSGHWDSLAQNAVSSGALGLIGTKCCEQWGLRTPVMRRADVYSCSITSNARQFWDKFWRRLRTACASCFNLTNVLISFFFYQHTNPGRQFVPFTKFCTEALQICGTSLENLLHVTHLAPRNLNWLLYSGKVCGPVFLYAMLLCKALRSRSQ